MADILSFTTGKTQGAGIQLGEYNPDYNELNRQKLIEQEQKKQDYINTKSTLDKLQNLSYEAWSIDQSKIDAELETYRQNYINALRETYSSTGTATLNYEQQRDLAKQQSDIAKKANASKETQNPYEQVIKLINADKDKHINREETLANLEKYKNDDMLMRNPEGLVVYNDNVVNDAGTGVTLIGKPTEEVLITKNKKDQYGNEVVGSTRQTVDEFAVLNNLLSIQPDIVKEGDKTIKEIDNNKFLQTYAEEAGYKSAREWIEKDTHNAYNKIKSLGLIKIVGKTISDSDTENSKGSLFSFNFGGGKGKNGFGEVEPVPSTISAGESNMITLFYNPVTPIKFDITREYKQPTINLNNGKRQQYNGVENIEVSAFAAAPFISTKDANLLKTKYSEIRSLIDNMTLNAISQEDFNKLSNYLEKKGDNISNYIYIDSYLISKNKGGDGFAERFTEKSKKAYKEVLISKYGFTEQEANKYVEDIDNSAAEAASKLGYRYAKKIDNNQSNQHNTTNTTNQRQRDNIIKYKDINGNIITESDYNKLNVAQKLKYTKI